MSDTNRRMLFSRKQGKSIGTYEYRLALVHTTSSEEAIALLDNPSLVQRHAGNTEKVLQLLLQATSDIHERRHYVDNFGTLAGITMFAAHMEGLKHFLGASRLLKHKKLEWQLPLSKWVGQSGCPAEIRGLRRYARSQNVALDIFNGNLERIVAPGHRAEWWVDVPIDVEGFGEPMNTPAFPISMFTAKSEEDARAGGGIATTVYSPLGYEALLEGTAHSLARTFVESFFPDVAQDFLVKYGDPLRMQSSLDEAAQAQLIRDHVNPYNITDLMISKALRAHGIQEFPRTLVRKLSDIALSKGLLRLEHLNESQTRCEIRNPAQALIDTLVKAQPGQLRDATLPYPDTLRILYESLLTSYKKGGDWDKVEHRQRDEAAVYVWESFLAHHVVVPLLERRIETEHASFYDADQSMAQLFDPGLPMVRVSNEQLTFQNIPDEVQTAWLHQMMQGEIAEQVLNDAELILCPRAHHLLPGMKSVDLSGGHCARNKRRGCGSWQQGRENVMPSCLFTRTLQTFGFIPIQQVSPAAPTAAEAPA